MDGWKGKRLDSLNGQCGSQPCVANKQAGGSIFVDPASLPAAIFALQREESAQVNLVANPDKITNDDAHCKLDSISFGANAFLNARLQQGFQLGVEVRVPRYRQKPVDAVEEALWVLVIPGAVGICPVQQDFVHPLKCFRELSAAAMHIEEGQRVSAHDGVKPRTSVVKVSLSKMSELRKTPGRGGRFLPA